MCGKQKKRIVAEELGAKVDYIAETEAHALHISINTVLLNQPKAGQQLQQIGAADRLLTNGGDIFNW